MTQFEPVPTSFFFWGQREYVQGSHVADGFLHALDVWQVGKLGKMKIIFHMPIVNQGVMVRYPDKEALVEARESLNAELHGVTENGDIFIGLKCQGEPVEDRLEDNELSLVSSAVLAPDENRVEMPFRGEASLATLLVALNKLLLNEILPGDGYVPWIVGRLVIQNVAGSRACKEIGVQLLNNVANTMTRSRVFLDGSAGGEIQFIRSRV